MIQLAGDAHALSVSQSVSIVQFCFDCKWGMQMKYSGRQLGWTRKFYIPDVRNYLRWQLSSPNNCFFWFSSWSPFGANHIELFRWEKYIVQGSSLSSQTWLKQFRPEFISYESHSSKSIHTNNIVTSNISISTLKCLIKIITVWISPLRLAGDRTLW